MILQEQEIKAILNKSPKVMKSNLGVIINQYEYNQKELLDLIQTYIKEKKGVDVKEIKLMQGMCPSFVNLMTSRGVHPLEAMQKSDAFNAFDYASWVAMNYYFNKYKEQ